MCTSYFAGESVVSLVTSGFSKLHTGMQFIHIVIVNWHRQSEMKPVS
jgi:hypothetical protein